MKSAVYTFGYNRPLFAHRVSDVLTLIRFVQTDEHAAKQVHLIGLGPVAGPIAGLLVAVPILIYAMWHPQPLEYVPYKLMTIGTVEEKILAMQARKRELVEGLAERLRERRVVRRAHRFLFAIHAETIAFSSKGYFVVPRIW